jgi:hypothetical protein
MGSESDTQQDIKFIWAVKWTILWGEFMPILLPMKHFEYHVTMPDLWVA